MKKLKVIVCGSTFGQLYLKALRSSPEKFQLIGILGTGSDRTLRCAEEYNIKVYKSIDEVPDDIDLACVAVRTAAFGGNGTEIALQLLEKGINVIQEHPSHPKDMEMCYRVARKKRLVYNIGNLYPHLGDVQRFIKCAKYLNNEDRLLYVDTVFSSQVSYPLIKILQLAMPSIQGWEPQKHVEGGKVFQVMNGRLGGIPICMQMNNEVVPRDANNYMHLLHKITFFYTGGHLTLEDTFGPVIWHPRMFIPIQTALAGTLNIRFPDNVYQNTGYILSNRNQNKTFEHILTAVWPEAILQDLYHVYAQIEKGIVDMQTNQREILCSKQWNQITKDFGYSQIIPEQYMTNISVEELKHSCEGKENNE